MVLISAGVQDASAPPASKNLRISCYAEGRDTDLIGEGNLVLAHVLTDGESDQWIPLYDHERYVGEVFVELTFYSADPPPQMSSHRSLTDLPDVLRDGSQSNVYVPPYAPQKLLHDTGTPAHTSRAHSPAPLHKSQSTSTIVQPSTGLLRSFSDLSIAGNAADDSADWTGGFTGADESTDSIGAQLQRLSPLPQVPHEATFMGPVTEITAQEAIYGTTNPRGRRPLPVATPTDSVMSPTRAFSPHAPVSPMRSPARVSSTQGISPVFSQTASPVRETSPAVIRGRSPAFGGPVSPAARLTKSPGRSTSPALARPQTPHTPTGRRPLPSPGLTGHSHVYAASPGSHAQSYGVPSRAGVRGHI